MAGYSGVMGTFLAAIDVLVSVLVLIGVVVTARQVIKVHVLVNSEFTAKLDRIEQLTEELHVSGITVPQEPPRG